MRGFDKMLKEKILELGFVLSNDEVDRLVEVLSEELKETVPKTEYEELITENKRLEGEVKEHNKQLEKLKTTAKDSDSLKEQINALQEENKLKDEKHKAEVSKMKIETAIDFAITQSKGKNATAIKSLLDFEKIKVGEDGKVTGIDEQFKTLIKSNDTSFLFGMDMKGSGPSNSNNNTPSGVTKEEFNKMSYKERLEIYNSNEELYKELSSPQI